MATLLTLAALTTLLARLLLTPLTGSGLILLARLLLAATLLAALLASALMLLSTLGLSALVLLTHGHSFRDNAP